MDEISGRLYVFFEDPFWVGVFEYTAESRLSACKVTFGAEPKDYEIWAYILEYYDRLTFSPAVEDTAVQRGKMNPKRVHRKLKKELKETGVGTKSQQALKLQQEQNKISRKTRSRKQKELEKERLFVLKQQKRKEKHRGR